MRLLSELISHHVGFASDSPALACGKDSLNYGDLDKASALLRDRLSHLGVRPGDNVAIAYPRSIDQIVSALAVMRAGAAYVPIDLSWPQERVAHILSDSGAAVLITPAGAFEALPAGVKLLDLHTQTQSTEESSPEEVTVIRPESLAYVIYTSGSTGVPKGVEITHANLAHLIDWHVAAFSVTARDRASHLAGLGFDASVWEVWPYLAAGACVVLADDMVRTSPRLLQDWLVAEEITVAFVPTPLAEPMMTEQWSGQTALRFLLTGGDTLHTVPIAGQPFAVVNNYGPTECTVVATSGTVLPDHTGMPTIGKAITETTLYILNEQGEQVADGAVGELCVGGGGVGRGYRNQPELTARCFVPDVFSDAAGGRMYKTGDQAMKLANGEVVFLGRADGQEKIRGQRLELDEITCVLNQHAAVAFSVVSAHGKGEEKHLVAYVLPADAVGSALSPRELQEFLAVSLPAYMIPSKFVRLAGVPLTSNGKVDPAALPEISAENLFTDESRRTALSPIEETILSIVRTLLQNDSVGVDDDFFLVGGHSLMGTRLVMRVREAFGVNLMLRDLFEAGTVAQLAAHVEALLVAELDSMSEEEAQKQVANG